MKLRIRYADQIVGIFVLVAIGLVVAFLVLIGSNQRWFKTNYFFKTEFASASGVAPGTAIDFKGFQIGKIDSISLNAHNNVDVRFYIYEEYVSMATKNSVIQLVSSPIPGLGGGLVFHPGRGTDRASPESFVANYDSVLAKDMIAKGLVDVPPTDDNIAGLFSSLKDILDNFNQISANLNLALAGRGGGDLGAIVSSAKTTIGQLPGVMTKVDGLVGETKNSLNTTMISLNNSLASLELMMDSFKDPTGLVPKLLGNSGTIKEILYDNGKLFKQIDDMLVNLNKSTVDIQSITGGLAGEVPKISSLILETRTAIKNAQDVLEGLKNNPLLKGGISEKPSQETKSNSFRSEEF